MVDLIQALQQGAPSGQQSPSRAQALQKQQLAKILLEGGQKTDNPLIAALSGFLGTQGLGQAAGQLGDIEEKERLRKIAREERQDVRLDKQIEFKNKEFGISQKKFDLLERKTNAEIKKIEREAEGVGKLDLDKRLKAENTLRDDYVKLSDDFIKQRDARGRILASAAEPSPAGDLALIFNYMKVLDPGSVVRESEFRTAAQAKAWLGRAEESGITVPNAVRSAIQRAISGELLLPEQRADFVNQSKNIFDQSLVQQEQVNKRFEGIATRNGLDVQSIVLPLELVESELVKKSQEDAGKSFKSVKEAEAANLPKGTEIVINGRRAVVE